MRQLRVKLPEKTRNCIFWVCDFLKGQPVRRHYNDIKFINENYNTTDAAERRRMHLTNLLSYAANNIDFYRDSSDLQDIESFYPELKDTITSRNKAEYFFTCTLVVNSIY